MEPGDLKMVDENEIMLIRGSTWNQLIRYVQEKTIVIVPGNGLKIDEIGPDGTKISIDGTDVCP
jgi:hypothetical protein